MYVHGSIYPDNTPLEGKSRLLTRTQKFIKENLSDYTFFESALHEFGRLEYGLFPHTLKKGGVYLEFSRDVNLILESKGQRIVSRERLDNFISNLAISLPCSIMVTT